MVQTWTFGDSWCLVECILCWSGGLTNIGVTSEGARFHGRSHRELLAVMGGFLCDFCGFLARAQGQLIRSIGPMATRNALKLESTLDLKLETRQHSYIANGCFVHCLIDQHLDLQVVL